MKSTLCKRTLVSAIIILFLTTQVAPPIYGSPVQFEENFNPNLSTVKKISDDIFGFNLVLRHFFLTFNSYIDIEYNSSVLNEPIPINSAAVVPITIQYTTDVPRNFLWFFPWWLRNIILYRSIIGPIQTIHLEVTNIPDWATVYLSWNNFFIDIPYSGMTSEKTTLLIISPQEGAPSKPYNLDLKASCDDIGRIKGAEHSDSVMFKPGFSPCLDINAPQFKECPRNQSTVIPINVTNCGNKRTLVDWEIYQPPEGFELSIVPPYFIFDINETTQFYLKIKPPNDYIGDEIITVWFIAKGFPLSPDDPIVDFIFYLVVKVT